MTMLMESPARAGWSLSGDEILAELDVLHDAQTRLTARRLELLRRLDDLGHAKDIGARDTAELISLRHRLDRHTVRRDLRTAHALDRYRTLASRLAGAFSGDDLTDDIGLATVVRLDARRRAELGTVRVNAVQAAVIAEILDSAPSATCPEGLGVAEAELVIAARTLLPVELKRLGIGVLNALDTDGPAPVDPISPDEADRTDPIERAHAAQTLWWSPGTAMSPSGFGDRIRGLRINGFLTGEHAELFQVLVDAGARPHKTPSGELDIRTLGQRRADAFCTILRAAAATGGELPAHGGIKPHLSITIPYAALRGAAARSGADPLSQSVRSVPVTGCATQAGRQRVGKLVFGEPLSAAEVRRIACDAGIIPIVLGSRSQPLDVGREERLVTPAIRRALIARDIGCVIPGCGAPPGHCDAHHLTHWVDGGETSIKNLALVCPPHHRAIHRGTWCLSITNGRVHATRPPWADPLARIVPARAPDAPGTPTVNAPRSTNASQDPARHRRRRAGVTPRLTIKAPPEPDDTS